MQDIKEMSYKQYYVICQQDQLFSALTCADHVIPNGHMHGHPQNFLGGAKYNLGGAKTFVLKITL